MTRFFKPIVVLAALLVALTLTIYRAGPQGFAGLSVAERTSRAAGPSDTAGKPYDLASLRILNLTLQRIRDNYVDPARIEPKGMLLSALDHVQRNVAEVLAEPSADKNSISVRVDTAQKTFDISGVDSPWALSSKLREIFKFVQQNLPQSADAREIEYQAISGMLATLDPHSQLLDPDMYRQMKIDTRGKFGGLGIGIGIRRDMLTVLSILGPVTPAARGGLKAGDHIVRINDESTINMLLSEAVNRLRGDPGTKVTVYVERDGQKGTKKVVLERAIIDVPNVVGLPPAEYSHPKILKAGVGYMRVKQFQGSTAEDIRREMSELSRQGLKGLIIDLRGNPGGLLDQAIKVSDIFLDGGTVVTTVGNAGKSRDEKRARNDGNEPHIPLVVLVNGSSASASEIVAGALKNLDRAVILGQTTFGKGSVQVLYDNDDDSALKLTIAQYLTPGDVSIQSVGITPDVQTVPVRVEKDSIWFAPSVHATLRESELDQHLDSRNARKGEKPSETVKYLAPPPKKGAAALSDDDEEAAQDEEQPIVEDETPKEDFEIELARDMIASLPQGVWRRHEVLAAGKAMIEKTRAAEDTKIGGALSKLGVDWTDGPAQGAPKLAASITTDKASNKVAAGQKLTLKATVRNDGNGPAAQLHAKIKSDYYLFDERELVFGKVGPGETKTAELTVKVPKDALTQVDDLRVEFSEMHNAKADPAQLKVQIDGLPRPVFAYTYQVIDDITGNQDGQIQRGEHVRLLVTIKNQGPGRSYKTQTTLKNNSGPGVFIHKGRFRVDNIGPGQTKQVAFDFEVQPELQDDQVQLELAVADQTVHEYVNEKLKFPVAAAGKAPVAASGLVQALKDHTELRSAPAADAPVVGYAAKQATFKMTGKSADGAWDRVEIEAGRPAFVMANAVKAGGSSKAGGFEPMWMVSPPVMALNPTSLETGEGKVHIHGQAKDERKVSDVYIVVQNHNAKVDLKKVFYKSNRNGSDPRKMDFDADVPLWPGENYVHVVARENGQVQSRQTLVVLREGGTPGNAAALSEPRPSSKN
jgi:carboxyl-terminal processing protease